MRPIGRAFLVSLAALAAACASAPPKTYTQGPEEIFVTAAADHFLKPQIESVRCTLSNDKGTWTAMTPSMVRVERSAEPLQVQCLKEGYEPAEFKVLCRSPRERAKAMDSFAMAMSVAIVPAAVFTAALVPALGAIELAQAAAMGGEAVARQSSDDICTYGGAAAIMKRSK